jgi:hypothetical protein
MRIELATDVLSDFDRADLLPKAQPTLSQAAVIRDRAKRSAAFQRQVPPGKNDGRVHDIPRGAGTDHSENEFVGGYRMKKIWSLLHHRIFWTIGGALLAIVAVPAIVALVGGRLWDWSMVPRCTRGYMKSAKM